MCHPVDVVDGTTPNDERSRCDLVVTDYFTRYVEDCASL